MLESISLVDATLYLKPSSPVQVVDGCYLIENILALKGTIVNDGAIPSEDVQQYFEEKENDPSYFIVNQLSLDRMT